MIAFEVFWIFMMAFWAAYAAWLLWQQAYESGREAGRNEQCGCAHCGRGCPCREEEKHD